MVRTAKNGRSGATAAGRKARPGKARPGKAPRPGPERRGWRRALRRGVAAVAGTLAALLAAALLAFAVLPVPVTPYMLAERARIGPLERDWVPLEAMAPAMALSAVAAEDAGFCAHWGFDIAALRAALRGGMRRGGSTISQQAVKNVFLWHGRSWPRKALEAALTPLVELAWPKRRILEVYLNVAEFGPGVFGAEAAARHHFGVPASALSAVQAARLAAILPNPKGRDPGMPSPFVRARAAAIADGAATIAADGRAACFDG